MGVRIGMHRQRLMITGRPSPHFANRRDVPPTTRVISRSIAAKELERRLGALETANLQDGDAKDIGQHWQNAKAMPAMRGRPC
jgi:hypothetical protein